MGGLSIPALIFWVVGVLSMFAFGWAIVSSPPIQDSRGRFVSKLWRMYDIFGGFIMIFALVTLVMLIIYALQFFGASL